MNNLSVEMTRRYFKLPKKVALRDSKVASKLITAWDVNQDKEQVLQIFLKHKDKISPQRYWEFLRTVWIVSGTLENVDTFRKLMSCNKKHQYCFSTPEEIAELQKMPQQFTVYRACNKENDGGISWTHQIDYAESYKETFFKEKIVTRSVTKNEIFALINRNKEHEIIILNPNH